MLITENQPLALFTTFGIGGPARWFVEATSEEEVVEATAWAEAHGLALFVLGGGSNLLIADTGFDGLVLRVGLRGIVVAPGGNRNYSSSNLSEADASGAEQAAEKDLFWVEGGKKHTSGAKARADSAAFVPGINPRPTVRTSSSAASEARIDSVDLIPGMNPWPTVRTSFSEACEAPVGSDGVDAGEKGLTYQAAAGEDWDAFVERTVQDNCAGVECLAGIPGSVGGTPVQNVGAYGQEVASAIERVRAFDVEDRAFVELSASECGFAYRRSRFNSTDRGRFIVTRVDYRLTLGGAPTLKYADLHRAILEGRPDGARPSLAEVAALVRQVRQSKGMLLVEGDTDCRSAGSFFKNPVVTEEQLLRIAEGSEKEPPRFPAGAGAENIGRVKVPAAWLIEQSGFAKGYSLGAAGISSRHTLALINRGGASAAEMLKLAGRIADAVESRFGIRLEMEPALVGF